jgi:hypothetical protein
LDLAKEGQAFTAAWLLGKCWEDDVISPPKKIAGECWTKYGNVGFLMKISPAMFDGF